MKERDECTPESGYNICVLDDYSRLGEQLTIIARVDTKKEAEEKVNELLQNGYKYYFFGTKDVVKKNVKT